MDAKQIHLLLIDNNSVQIKQIKRSLASPRSATYCVEVAETLDRGLGYIAAGGINAVILGYELFAATISQVISSIRTAAAGMPILLIVDQEDEAKIAELSGEIHGDYIIKEYLNSYVLTRAIHYSMERQVMMLELEQYISEFMSSEERFRNIIANNADAMVVLNMGLEVRFANFAAEQLFEKKAHEIIGKKFEYPVTINSAVELLIKQGGQKTTVAEMRAVLTEWEGEKAFLASLRDITDRKRAEEENLKLQNQLIEAEKLMSVGMLASGVAHEINNPLTIILGFTQILMRHTKEAGVGFEQLRDIETAALRCKKIVSQLLMFSHQESFSFDSIDINTVADNATDLMGFQLGSSNVKVLKNYQQGLPNVFGNMQQLEQVFINLMTNARDAMPGGGTIEIATRMVNGADQRSTEAKNNRFIEVSFTDTGTGIAPENINKIFDPFFTTKTVDKGTGLGLSVCVGIIEKHRGKIKVESMPGRGSTFRVILPVQVDQQHKV